MTENNSLQAENVCFSGIGKIRCSDISEKCQYELAQKANGTIEVLCYLSLNAIAQSKAKIKKNQQVESDFGWWEELNDLQFEGETPAGDLIKLTDVNHVSSPQPGQLRFSVAQAETKNLKQAVPAFMVFRLVNHKLPSTPEIGQSLSDSFMIQGNLFALQLPTGLGWLRGVENEYEIVQDLEKNGGIAVTSELFLAIYDDGDEETAIKTANRLCCVLTLLTGNRVNWLNCNLLDRDGKVIRSRYQHAVTRGYQSTNLLDTLSDRKIKLLWTKDDYVRIIERMMSRFESAEQKWNIVAIINSWHEAISSTHFAEQQGQLLANCMEMLRQSYVDHGGNEYILPQDVFGEKKTQEKLIKSLKKLLQEYFPSNENSNFQGSKELRSALGQIALHIKGANRYGFNFLIQEMASKLNLLAQSVVEDLNDKRDAHGFLVELKLDATEPQRMKSLELEGQESLKSSIRAFVRIRDRLTHRGHFLVQDDPNGTDRQIHSQRMRQERFMERFVGAFLASILGWQQVLPTSPLSNDAAKYSD